VDSLGGVGLKRPGYVSLVRGDTTQQYNSEPVSGKQQGELFHPSDQDDARYNGLAMSLPDTAKPE
jgi:hypothetical protein